ncbi:MULTISPECIES: hypothetical protein [unclassified Acinetobacter]|uniref:hypothetical protein n=1 Tax=unclassified Acinetobacter TaxID=196816 RepID=UPI0035BA5E38
MRLSHLSICLFGLSLAGCASVQSTSTATKDNTQQLQQQATSALTQIYQQYNYDYSGRWSANLQLKDNVESNQNLQRQQLDLLKQSLATITNNQQILEILQPEVHKNAFASSAALSLVNHYWMNSALSNTEFSYEGTVDLRNRMISLDLAADHYGSNFSSQVRFPMLLDLSKKRLYLNSFDPQKVHPKAPAQAYYVDFAEYSDVLNSVDWKAFLNYVKAANQIYYGYLLEGETVAQADLTSAERAQGAVKKIRLNTSIEHLMLKSSAFELANQNYLKKIFNAEVLASKLEEKLKGKAKLTEGTNSEEEFEKFSAALFLSDDQLTEQEAKTVANDAVEIAKAAVNDAAEVTPSKKAAKIDTSISMVSCEQAVQQKVQFGSMSECIMQYGDRYFALDAEHGKKKDPKGFLALIDDIKDKEGSFYKSFERADATELLEGQQWFDLMKKNHSVINDILPKQKHDMIMDLTVDSRGRVLHSNLQVKLDEKISNDLQLNGTIDFQALYHNYGSAKINPRTTSNAKPIEEHPFGKIAANAYKEYTEKAKAADSDEIEYTLEPRDDIQRATDKIYQDSKSYEKAFATAFVATINRDYPRLLASYSAQDWQEIALIHAVEFGDKSLYQPNAQTLANVATLKQKHDLQQSEKLLQSVAVLSRNFADDAVSYEAEHPKSVIDTAALTNLSPEAAFAQVYQSSVLKWFGDIAIEADDADKQALSKLAVALAKAHIDNQQGTFKPEQLRGVLGEGMSYLLHYDSYLKAVKALRAVQQHKTA